MTNTPDIWRDMDRAFMGPWRPLMRQLDDMFNEVAGFRGPDSSWSMMPSVDVNETEDHYIISVDIPGVDKDDIDIELQGNQLIVTGERKSDGDRGTGRSRSLERRYGKFQRMITLPDSVANGDDVEANYKDGVLKIAVPKSMESKTRKIKIGDGSKGVLSRLFGKSDSSSDSTVEVKSSNAQGESSGGMTH